MSMDTVSPLRQRMIEDMNARRLGAGTQRGHIRRCKQFVAFLKRNSPELRCVPIQLAISPECDLSNRQSPTLDFEQRVLDQKTS